MLSSSDAHYSSTYWRTIREQCLARDGYRCRLCNGPDDLQAHHRTYQHFGKELLEDLTTLCAECHDVVTNHQRGKRYANRTLPVVQELVAPLDFPRFASSYQEIIRETNDEMSPRGRGAALDAQWRSRRPTECLEQGQETYY